MTYILSFIVAFGVTAIAGQILIPALRRLKAGQSIREDGPTWHLSKQGFEHFRDKGQYHIFIDTVLGLAERSARNFGVL